MQTSNSLLSHVPHAASYVVRFQIALQNLSMWQREQERKQKKNTPGRNKPNEYS